MTPMTWRGFEPSEARCVTLFAGNPRESRARKLETCFDSTNGEPSLHEGMARVCYCNLSATFIGDFNPERFKCPLDVPIRNGVCWFDREACRRQFLKKQAGGSDLIYFRSRTSRDRVRLNEQTRREERGRENVFPANSPIVENALKLIL